MLTSVLRDSLGGNCTTTMIATLAADHKSLDVSMSPCHASADPAGGDPCLSVCLSV